MRLLRCVIALQLTWILAIPHEVWAQAPQSAGQVALVVPQVKVEHGTQQLPATAHTPVYWSDVVDTLRLGRARIALNDGSILNVGSESSLRVVKHDAGAQQTQMELTYGRVRAQAVRITKPGGNCEIRTRVGTAGVVGTDFFLALEGAILRLIVFEGLVRFCNLAGACIDIGAGMMSTIRGNQQPDPASITPNALLTEAVNSTDVSPREIVEGPTHHSPWTYVGVVAAAAVPAIVAGTGAFGTSHTVTVPPPPHGKPCVGCPCSKALCTIRP